LANVTWAAEWLNAAHLFAVLLIAAQLADSQFTGAKYVYA